MKPFFAFVLILCLLASAACAYAYESTLGYSIELDEKWLEISPATLPEFEKNDLLDALSSMGLNDAYFSSFDQRTHEVIFCITREYGNIKVTPDETEAATSALQDQVNEWTALSVPFYKQSGFPIILEPQVLELSGRQWAMLGFSSNGHETYHCKTINEHTGRCLSLVATRVPQAVLTSLLETLVFTK